MGGLDGVRADSRHGQTYSPGWKNPQIVRYLGICSVSAMVPTPLAEHALEFSGHFLHPSLVAQALGLNRREARNQVGEVCGEAGRGDSDSTSVDLNSGKRREHL